ncbi:MAG: peptidoglycan editing factor PgeF [Brevinema sp.]
MIRQCFELHSEIIAGTTLRSFGNFSIASHFSQDEKIKSLQNRKELLALTKTRDIFVPSLIHTDNVIDVNRDNLDQAADAIITNQKNQLIGVTTADCLPIFIYDPEHKVVGCVHSGRMGVKLKIVLKTIEKMTKNYQSDPKKLFIHIGPHICEKCYEVESNILKEFGIDNKNLVKGLLPLQSFVIEDLKKIGVSQISTESLCTKCSGKSEFFSHRNKDLYRMLSFIALR